MSRIPLTKMISDLRAGIGDDRLMAAYRLTLRDFERLLQKLIKKQLITHTELYQCSEVYKSLSDFIASRKFPRVYVRMAVRVYDDEHRQRGFIRDLSESGIRVAGLNARIGQYLQLRLPLSELGEWPSVEFEAVCKWKIQDGKSRKYNVVGLEITQITDRNKDNLRRFIEFCEEKENLRHNNLNDASSNITAKPAGHANRQFNGTMEEIDILDIVQLLILSQKRTILHVTSQAGDECKLFFDDGQLIHAELGDMEGKDAFYACMNFYGGAFRTETWYSPYVITIHEPAEFLLLESARKRDDLNGCTTRIVVS